MHLFAVAFAVSGVLFALLHQQSLILYFLLTIGAYMVISFILPGKSISNRKKIMLATWSDPSEGVIQVRVPCRAQKIEALIKNNTSDQKFTLTHFVIKATGMLLNQSSDINGKLVFGKFVPHDTTDVSCLVDIAGGKDLALLLVTQVDKKSIKDIARFIRQKGSKIKTNKGDADHKKRTKLADLFPAFLVTVFLQIARFFSNFLGVNVPALALKRHQFGAACVTSLGMLNFQDATAPFSGFMDCSMLISANAVHDAPVVQNGKIQVGRLLYCNFVVDHRYIDGGKAKTFVQKFTHVFNNPELYLDSSGPVKESKAEEKRSE